MYRDKGTHTDVIKCVCVLYLFASHPVGPRPPLSSLGQFQTPEKKRKKKRKKVITGMDKVIGGGDGEGIQRSPLRLQHKNEQARKRGRAEW